MPLAFVLVNVQIGSEREVLEALKKVEGVEEAYVVYGGLRHSCEGESQKHG